MSAITNEIKARITQATKFKDEVVKNVLKVVLGEIQTQETRNSKELTDEQVVKVLKKTLDGVNEMLQYKPYAHDLMTERATLEGLMPPVLNFYDIVNAIESDGTAKMQIIESKSDGQAMGIAMKLLKDKGAVDGNLVKEVIKSIRHPVDFFEGIT